MLPKDITSILLRISWFVETDTQKSSIGNDSSCVFEQLPPHWYVRNHLPKVNRYLADLFTSRYAGYVDEMIFGCRSQHQSVIAEAQRSHWPIQSVMRRKHYLVRKSLTAWSNHCLHRTRW